MPIDASIYGQIKPIAPMEGPLDQYAKMQTLKTLMGQNQLQELQRTKLQRDLEEEQATHDVFRNAPAGTKLEDLLPDVMRASPTKGIAFQKQILDQQQARGSIAHTAAQTADLSAGHIAGSMAALAKAGGSDESVRQTSADLAPYIGEQAAEQRTQRLLAIPKEQRLAYITAQAATHPRGQAALKELFPPAHMQDTGGTVVPVNTSTLPGGPAPGSVVPGAIPLVKTVSPDAAMHDVTARRGQNMTDQRAREMNGILEGQGAEFEASRKTMAKMIADGEAPFPTITTRNPMAMARATQLIADAKAINPDISAEHYPTIKRTVASFVDGKPGQSLKAISTATDHVETLRELAAAVKNGNTPLFNKIANSYATATGAAAPGNLAAAAQIVGAEIVKGISGAGGGVEDRAKAEGAFSNVKSPEQMEGAINTVTKLMGGQLKGLRQQYEAGTYGRKDFDRYLTPAAKAALERASAKPAATGAPAAAASGGWSVVR